LGHLDALLGFLLKCVDDPRPIFGCGCPIYARLLVRHPDPNVAPCEFNGSLAKLGVWEKLAAEEIGQWTVQFLSAQNGKLDPNTFKTAFLCN
jgi:hypothetical protein